MMFESLNMMIPLQCVDDRSDGDAPPGFGPGIPIRNPWPPLAPSRGSHLGLFNAAPRMTSVRGPRSYVAIMDRFGSAEVGVLAPLP